MPITATAIGILARNYILDCPATEVWGRSEHSELSTVRSPVAPGSRVPATSSSGTLGFSYHSRTRGSATTATPRFTLRGQPPRERGCTCNKLRPAREDRVASSLATAMLAASSGVWSHTSSGRGGTGGTGSRTKALSGSPPMRSSPSLPTWLPCNAVPPYWSNANNGDRYWHFGGKLHIRLPGRRSMGPFPAFRETLRSEFGRSSKGSRVPATSSSGVPDFSSR